MLLAIGSCPLVLYTTHAMIGRNMITALKGKKHPASIYLVAKQLSFLCFRFENGQFCTKGKNFHLKILCISHNSGFWVHNLPKK